MTEVGQDFEIFAGDTKDIDITVRDSGGNLFNLTGATIKWILYNSNVDYVHLTKTTASGIIVDNPTSGIFTVSLLPDDTLNLKPGNWYAHEAEVIDAFGNESTVTTGTVVISKALA